jgi:hypothetical protein
MSYVRRPQQDIPEKGKKVVNFFIFHCVEGGSDLDSCSNLPVVIAYLITAWTAFMSGCHRSDSERDFPPRKKDRFPRFDSIH